MKTILPILIAIPTALFLQTSTGPQGGIETLILNFISTVGIPAGIALYLLVRMESAFKKMENATDRNTQALTVLLSKFGCDEEVQNLLAKKEEGGK